MRFRTAILITAGLVVFNVCYALAAHARLWHRVPSLCGTASTRGSKRSGARDRMCRDA